MKTFKIDTPNCTKQFEAIKITKTLAQKIMKAFDRKMQSFQMKHTDFALVKEAIYVDGSYRVNFYYRRSNWAEGNWKAFGISFPTEYNISFEQFIAQYK